MVSEPKESTGVTFSWEKAAMNGEEMPDGLDYPDQILYLSLRMLYSQYRQGIIDRSSATTEKRSYLTSTVFISSGISWKKNGSNRSD